ncbi:MAG: hypothetical protein ACI9MC_000767 [Kiritimatiellia bacterium]|jgi:hypothetical protein
MGTDSTPNPIQPVRIEPPPPEQRTKRDAQPAKPDDKRNRYHLPTSLKSASPVGYRTRVSMTEAQAAEALTLLSLERPTAFAPEPAEVLEQELFEEASLGVLTSRQSTNYQGHRQVTLGPSDSRRAAEYLNKLVGMEAPVLDNAAMTHVVLSKPYRTPFTMLLTMIGHKPLISLVTVPIRMYRKKFHLKDDIPTIGYLQHLHVGILADALERATIIASGARRRAQVFMRAFSDSTSPANEVTMSRLEALAGLTRQDKASGWRIALVVQVGEAIDGEQAHISPATCRLVGANILAFRSERIQPGVNAEDKAPEQYLHRQDMDVSSELTYMAGRAGYNAFAHWTGADRERSKDLLLLERIDVLTPNGKQRLREVRRHLEEVTDQVVKRIPMWIDLPAGRAFSRNAAKGKKAFALAGQRIYITGLSRDEVRAEGIGWNLAVRALGAAASRAALVAEIMGATEIPDGCDLLAGTCIMAGPVNQNDIGKSFYGAKDLLYGAYQHRDPTSLLMWTLKAKTIADPIGNEEQLLNPARKGALVDLRPGPHEVSFVLRRGRRFAMRKDGTKFNRERAFSEVGNFVTAPDGTPIAGNQGKPWPQEMSCAPVWTAESEHATGRGHGPVD